MDTNSNETSTNPTSDVVQSIRWALSAELNAELKIAYYLVPKAASSSIYTALQPTEVVGAKFDTTGYRTITAVRNPWDRVLSLFCDIQQHDTRIRHLIKRLGLTWPFTWTQFVEAITEIGEIERHLCSQYLLHPPSCDIILRFEDLEAGWRKIQDLYPSLPNLGAHNTTDHEPFEHYYTPRLADLIAKRYQKDIEKYGHTYPICDANNAISI